VGINLGTVMQNGLSPEQIVDTTLPLVALVVHLTPRVEPGRRFKISAIIACYRDAPAVPHM